MLAKDTRIGAILRALVCSCALNCIYMLLGQLTQNINHPHVSSSQSFGQSVTFLPGFHLTQNAHTGWTAFTCSCYVGYKKACLFGDAVLGLFNLCFRQQRSKLFWRLRLSMQATTATASKLRKGCACLPSLLGLCFRRKKKQVLI